MSKLRIRCLSVSLDGYVAGPNQGRDYPLGVRGEDLHNWMFPADGSPAAVDNDFVRRADDNIGAWIMGRNMFGPIRGDWPDDQWQGWWGDDPPFHVPVFVLTHHPRAPFSMTGGTTFHFVTDGIEAALARAREAAGSKDIRLGGGAATVRQYLRARLVDEIHLAVLPMLLGSGESLFAGLDLPALGYEITEHVASPTAMHVVMALRASS